MDIDMLEVINDAAFNTGFEIARIPIARHPDGRLIGTDPADLVWEDLTGVIQPAKGKDTQHLQQGDQTKPGINIWCGQLLNPTWGDLPLLGDLINWHGRNYRVVDAMDWSQYGYWKAVALEVRGNG